jgi:phosphatidylinositol phospholipase C, delta
LAQILGVDYEVDDNIEDEKLGQQIAPEYKHLIAIHASKPKNGTRRALTDDPGNAKRLSLSEQALERAASLYGADIVR